MVTKPFSNQFERGHSFRYAGAWQSGKYYLNDDYVTDFISYGSCFLACRQSHLSSNDNKPVILYDDDPSGEYLRTPVDVSGPLWEFSGTAIDKNAFRFLTEEAYQELVDSGEVLDDVLYFIYNE